LSPATARRLIRLRALLDEAVLRASDRSHVGRQIACVLLDGACELALELVARDRGLVSKHDRLEDTFSQLRQKHGLPASVAWKSVRDLHTARNAAQHQGVPPDGDELASWVADARTFVAELVAFGFGAALGEIRVAGDIEDAVGRNLLLDAESAAMQGQPQEALQLAARALDHARRRFQGHRRGEDPWEQPPRPSFGRPPDTATALAVARVSDLGEILPFASDLSEYLWLNGRLQQMNGGAPVTAADADRAIAFVVEWTRRLESYLDRYPVGALAEYKRHARAPTSDVPEADPSIRAVDITTVYERDGELVADLSVQLQDLPEHQAIWREGFNRDFARPFMDQPGSHWGPRKIGLEGELFLSLPLTEADQVVPAVQAAIERANEEYEPWLANHDEREAASAVQAIPYKLACQELTFQSRPLIGDVAGSPYIELSQQIWFTEITLELVPDEHELPRAELARMLNAELAENVGVDQDSVRIIRADLVSPNQLRDALTGAVHAAFERRQRRENERARLDEVRDLLHAQVAGQLRGQRDF